MSKPNRRQQAKRYKIPARSIQLMLELSGFRCWACRRRFGDDIGWHNIDHCHRTGNVRGLLCRECNLLLGQLGDSARGIWERMLRLIGYLLIADRGIARRSIEFIEMISAFSDAELQATLADRRSIVVNLGVTFRESDKLLREVKPPAWASLNEVTP